MPLPVALESLPADGEERAHAISLWAQCVEVRRHDGLEMPGEHEAEMAARYGELLKQARECLRQNGLMLDTGQVDALKSNTQVYRTLHLSAKELEMRLLTRARGRPPGDSRERVPNPYEKLRSVK